MTTDTLMQPATEDRPSGNQPNYIAKMRNGYGKKASYERIGVAWLNDDGSVYVKPYGTQVIGSGFTLYPVSQNERAGD